MKKFYTFINESQKTNELLFIKSSHLYELEITFDFIETKISIIL
jgi:hypothetical protein